MLKRVLLLTLCVLGAVSAAAQQGMVPYVHPERGFSIQVPATWQIAPSSADYDLQAQDATCLLQVGSAAMNGLVDPHRFAAEWERLSVGPDSTYRRRLSQADRSVSGVPAVQSAYESVAFGGNAIGNITIFSVPGRTFVITIVCASTAYPAQGALIEAILASFQLPRPPEPPRPAPPVATPGAAPSVGAVPDGWLGLEIFLPATKDLPQVGLTADQAVMVSMVRPGSPAAAAGLAKGDIVVGMSGRTIRTVDDVRAAPTPQGQPVEVIAIRRGETRKFTLVPAVRPAGLASHEFMLAVFAGVLIEKLPGWTWIDIPGPEPKAYLSRQIGGGRVARIDLDRMPPGWTNERAVIEAAATARRKIGQQYPQATLFDGPAYEQEPASRELPGAQFEAEYAAGGKPIRSWYVILSDGYGGAVTWSYAAPEDAFEAGLPEARRLVRSLLIFPRPVAGGVR